jgi:hypothetical protein
LRQAARAANITLHGALDVPSNTMPKHRPLHWALALACLAVAPHIRAEPPAQAQPNAAQQAASAAQKQTPPVDPLRVARKAAWHAIMRTLQAPSELPQPVRAELQLHARRLAKLVRIRSLAVAAHDQAVVQRVDKAFVLEAVRHREQLTRLWPAPPPPTKLRAAPKDKDDDDEDRPSGEGEGENDGEEG